MPPRGGPDEDWLRHLVPGQAGRHHPGSTETNAYVLEVVCGVVSIPKSRSALACGLVADAAGMAAAIGVGNLFYH
jgi:spore maturation protein SpmB